MIGIEQSNDAVEGLFSSPVFENPDIGVLGNCSLDLLCELNRAVMRIVVADETAYEADHNVGRRGVCFRPEGRGIHGPGERGQACSEDHQTNDQCTKCGDPAQTNSYP